MRRLVIICPDCGDSFIIQALFDGVLAGVFESKCGARISYTVTHGPRVTSRESPVTPEGAQRVHIAEQS
jgi:hypothetical protein